jgi:hypothetical protein
VGDIVSVHIGMNESKGILHITVRRDDQGIAYRKPTTAGKWTGSMRIIRIGNGVGVSFNSFLYAREGRLDVS